MLLASPLGKKDSQLADAQSAQQFPCSYLALVVVDAQGNVRNSFWNGSEGASIKQMLCGSDTSLRPELAAIVSRLIERHGSSGSSSHLVMRDGGRTLRLSPLAGPDGDLFALVMEADAQADTLARCAMQYRLTRRQAEVLALVLDGASASDVAHALVISEYTAQGYVKSLLAKTNSRNRAAMVAKVLNWNTPRPSTHSLLPEKVAVN
jgi:DNA-binding CsgD family transcriptional regulator